eukprot:872900_1
MSAPATPNPKNQNYPGIAVQSKGNFFMVLTIIGMCITLITQNYGDAFLLDLVRFHEHAEQMVTMTPVFSYPITSRADMGFVFGLQNTQDERDHRAELVFLRGVISAAANYARR